MTKNSLSKIAVVVAIAISLLALKMRPIESERDSRIAAIASARAFLESREFTVTDQKADDHISARRGDCDVIVKSVAAEGWNEAQMKIIATGRELIFVVGGKTYPDNQPIWKTWSRLQIRRFLRNIGIRLSEEPVYGISPSLKCERSSVDWTQIGTVGDSS